MAPFPGKAVSPPAATSTPLPRSYSGWEWVPRTRARSLSVRKSHLEPGSPRRACWVQCTPAPLGGPEQQELEPQAAVGSGQSEPQALSLFWELLVGQPRGHDHPSFRGTAKPPPMPSPHSISQPRRRSLIPTVTGEPLVNSQGIS